LDEVLFWCGVVYWSESAQAAQDDNDTELNRKVKMASAESVIESLRVNVQIK